MKLGYGGTKTEMERLLADAEKISGVEYDISNLGDVYDAIHVIQGELGLTGVAADEAASTMSGSINAMKANWENLLATLTNGGDLTAAVSNMVDSVVAMLSNALPAIGNIITGLLTSLGTFLAESLPQILQQIIDWTVTSIPMIAESGITLLVALVSAMPSIISQIGAALPELISGITNALINHIPEMIQAGIELISAIVEDLPTIIVNITAVIPQLIGSLSDAILSNLPVIIQAGFDLMIGLAKGIINAIPQLISNALAACGQLLSSIKGFFGIHSPSRVFASIGDNLMLGLAGGIEDGESVVQKAMDGVARMTTRTMNVGVNATAATATDSVGGTSIDVIRAIENMKVYIYGDKLVGYIAPDMDKALGLRVGSATRGYA